MLYLGHFSFAFTSKARGQKPQPWHGYFTAVAEASNVQGALKKLEALVLETVRSSELLKDAPEIFLESCVELRSVPRAGLVAHVALEEGESLGSISTTLPDVANKHAASYHFEPESVEEDGGFDAEPFVVIKRQKASATKKKPRRK